MTPPRYGRSTASWIIGGVAVVVLLAGKLADRFGQLRLLQLALPTYGAGFLVPFLFTSPLLVALAVPFIAIGGGVIAALPYAVLMPLMPDEEHGALTGSYSFSRGLRRGSARCRPASPSPRPPASSPTRRAIRRCGASAPSRCSPA